MTSIPGETASRAFDELITVPAAAMPALDSGASDVASGSRPSFRTVVAAFLAIAIAQVGVAAIASVIFDLDGVRLVLLGLIVGPAALYVVVAAWDRRELLADGQLDPASWVWALIPPVYLALRRRASSGGGSGAGTAFGWSVAQAAITTAFVVLALAIGVTSPASSADAAPTAASTTTEQVADVVERRWADAGISGTADCGDPAELEPGDEVQCTGVYAGTPLVFSASVTESDAGGATVSIASWSAVPVP